MNWYLADLVHAVTHAGETRPRAQLTTVLVEAADEHEAYDKAMACGRDHEEDDVRFVGLHELTRVLEPLGDGAELAWQERPGAEAEALVTARGELGVFRSLPSTAVAAAGEPARAPGVGDLRPPRVVGLHHAQVMIPPGGEAEARRFYGELLGLVEIEKPTALRARGGLWFQAGEQQLHLGVEAPGVDRTATRAHAAYQVTHLDAWRARLAGAGYEPKDGEPIDGLRRFELRDPFGNRVELVEPA